MMKRHIAIPLLCVVLVAALSIPVFATSANPSFPYPENDVSGSVSISVSFNSFYQTRYVLNESFSFGSLWTGLFKDPVSPSDNFIMDGDADFRFNLSVYVGGSFYIAIPSTISNYGFGSLSSYLDNSNSYVVNFGSNWPVNIYTPSGSTFSKSSGTATLSVRFVCFDNVPAGNYTVNYSLLSSNELVCFGVYATQGNAMQNIVQGVVNGSISYSEGIDQIMDVYESSLNNATDIQSRTLLSLELGNTLDQLIMQLSIAAAENAASLSSDMQTTVDQFADGSIDLKDAMDMLSSDFSASLSGAQTVEEAQTVTAVYQVKLLQLENENQVKLMEGLDAVITDEEIQKADDYYAAEDELVNAFDVANFDAQLQFDLWWLQMPRNETIEYKKFFDYLMNESDIKYFITIPLAMSLVAIIMGTRMRTRPDRVVERSTTVDSGGSRTTTVKYKND